MAEALAVVGIVASIVQLVDFGSKVLVRLNEFQTSLGEIPKTYHVKAELPVLLDTLKQTKHAISVGSIRDETKQALLPAIDGCRIHVELLDALIGKTLPLRGDSWVEKSRKAFSSLRQETKVRKITTDLRGYIHTLTYYHAAASSTLRPSIDPPIPRPAPSSTVPFRRDRDFVDRDILPKILQICSQPSSRAALVGLGGVGKSQLAIEYAYQVREKSLDVWVFWIHASSTARFEEDYKKIAEKVKIPDWDKPGTDVLVLIYNWLCDEANGRWVMIIDNADDLSVLSHLSSGRKSRQDNDSAQAVNRLSDFLPQSSNGSILITSRSRDVAFRLTESASDIIDVDPMDQAHALALLKRKLETDFDEDVAEELLEALDYMPLAITQSAAYIRQRAPRMTSFKYLQDLRRSDGDRVNLLKKDVGDSRRDGRASNSIIATWQITFEHIRQQRPSAARLLALMSFFDRQAIPESLLDHHYQENDDIEYDFEEDIFTLSGYSLIGTNLGGDAFEMHRLVQFSTKTWLELNDELEKWKERFITVLNEAFPQVAYENWTACGELLPHVELSLTSRPKNNGCLLQWASTLSKAAWYADDMGNHKVAEKMIRRALEGYEKALGEDHPDTLGSANTLAIVLKNQGKYEAAEEVNLRALEGHERVLGKDHPHTLTSVNNLALILIDQGKYEAAEEMNKRSLEGCERVLGKDHPNTLTNVSNLALVLGYQGKYETAEEMIRRALEGRENVLGKDHPDTLVSVYNLAFVTQKRKQYEAATELYQRAMSGLEKTLGLDHPVTATCAKNYSAMVQEMNSQIFHRIEYGP